MKNKTNTILVTGGAGYIGSFTVKELIKNNFNVVVLDSLESGHRKALHPKAILEVCNTADILEVTKIFEKYQPVAVIDFAAYLAVGESMEDPEKYFKNNVTNFVKLLDVMTVQNCRYVIKSSTAATYGNPLSDDDFPLQELYTDKFTPETSTLLQGMWGETEVVGEDFFQKFLQYYHEAFKDRSDLKLSQKEITALRIPSSFYGLTKLLDEILMNKFESKGLKSVALRYFNVCGAAEDGHSGDAKPNPTNLMTLVIYSALNKIESLKVFGDDYPTSDGTGIRDYIHPLDLATGHLAALKYLLNGGESNIFNLGNGKGFSVFEVIKAVEKASGTKVKFEIVPRRSGDPAISIANPSRAQSILNWHAKYSLDEMAQTAWSWHSQHPNGYIEN